MKVETDPNGRDCRGIWLKDRRTHSDHRKATQMFIWIPPNDGGDVERRYIRLCDECNAAIQGEYPDGRIPEPRWFNSKTGLPLD